MSAHVFGRILVFHVFQEFIICNMEYQFKTTWDGMELDYNPVKIQLAAHGDGDCRMTVQAPFFNDPPAPNGRKGEPFPSLWDFEVVEAFFLNDEDKYLEVELCPHGQHLVLLLNGQRNIVEEQLPLDFNVMVDGTSWKGEAILPRTYFPPNVTKFNAYAIHGSGDDRVYMSLYPVKSEEFTEPDFHRLQYFQPIDVSSILKYNSKGYTSQYWSKIGDTP